MTVAVPGSDSSMEHGRAEGPSGLAVWTDQSHNCCILRLSGRLCAETVRLLDSHVDILGCRSCDQVTIDLSTLEDMDQVGARLIVGFGHYVAGRGGRFRVDGASAAVRAMIARAEIEVSG